MSTDSERWKAKYLQCLEDQEKLEKRWDAREDLLRRGLVRSSLAAEGTDKAVDQCMQELRETLRRNDMDSGLAGLIPRLEKAVLDSEHRRQERVTQVSSALGALVGQLQELPLPREISKPLKSFAKQLQDRSSQQGELPLLLGELSEFQRQALALREGEEASRPGFLQRLFGGRDDGAAGDAVGDAAAVPENHAEDAPTNFATAPAVEVSPVAVVVPVADTPRDTSLVQEPAAVAASLPVASLAPVTAPLSIPAATLLDSLPLPAALLREEPSVVLPAARFDGGPEYALPATPEPGYSAIAEHVETTLVGLLDELPVPERHRPQADTLRQRIVAGLNMYELVPVLDDFAVLMLAVADLGQREFEVGHVFGVQSRFEIAQQRRDIFRGEAEQFLNLRVVDFIGLQVPVPQAQLTGLQRQRQARFAFAQGLIGGVQLAAALGDAVFEFDLGLAQLALGTASMLDFLGQFEIELLAARLGLLQVLDQMLILEAPQQTAIDQPIDLPRHHAQRAEQNQPEPAPATRLFITAPEQKANRRQQTGQGKGQERWQAHRISHASGQRRGADQAEHPGLLHEIIGGHQRNAGTGQRQAGHGRTEQEHPEPDRLGLTIGNRRVERRHLNHPQGDQRQQPHQPDADHEVALRAPEQTGADQTIDQHEQGGQQRALIQQTRALDRHFDGIVLADNPGFHGGARQFGAEGHGQRSCSYKEGVRPKRGRSIHKPTPLPNRSGS